MRVFFFVFSLNTRNSGHLYTRLWMHEKDIPWKPWREEKINHLKQLMKCRKILVKAENTTCVPTQTRSSSLSCVGFGVLACAPGQGWDGQWFPGADAKDMVTSGLLWGWLWTFNPALLAGARVFSRRDFSRNAKSCLFSWKTENKLGGDRGLLGKNGDRHIFCIISQVK